MSYIAITLSFAFVSCLSSLASVNGSTVKQAKLTVHTSFPSNGASININPQSTTTAHHNYNIYVHYQDAYDLKLSLDNSWGFERSTISTMSITIDGFTPYPKYHADVFIVFSVADLQYFTFYFHLDDAYIYSTIYPSVSIPQNTQKVSQWISDIDTIHLREDRVSNNNQWITLHEWQQQSLWPLTFEITNDPRSKQSRFEFHHNTTGSFAAGYTFNASFMTNECMDVYIMGQNSLEMFSISSFDVLLTNHSSSYPTIAPTNDPTESTEFPTMHATDRETVNRLRKLSTSETMWDTNMAYDTDEERRHKSYAIMIVVGLLVSVLLFFAIVVLLMKCCKPVNFERKLSSKYEDDQRTETESSETHDNYMNEGPLSHSRYNIRQMEQTSPDSNGCDFAQNNLDLGMVHLDVSPQLSSLSVSVCTSNTDTIHTSESRSNTMSASEQCT